MCVKYARSMFYCVLCFIIVIKGLIIESYLYKVTYYTRRNVFVAHTFVNIIILQCHILFMFL